MEATLVPIFICVILPIAIVWLVVRARKHEMDKKTEIMLKAIENGAQIDPQLFKTKQSTRSIKQELMDKFTGACVTSFMGIAFLAIGLLNRSNPGMFKGHVQRPVVPGDRPLRRRHLAGHRIRPVPLLPGEQADAGQGDRIRREEPGEVR